MRHVQVMQLINGLYVDQKNSEVSESVDQERWSWINGVISERLCE